VVVSAFSLSVKWLLLSKEVSNQRRGDDIATRFRISDSGHLSIYRFDQLPRKQDLNAREIFLPLPVTKRFLGGRELLAAVQTRASWPAAKVGVGHEV
jgi:hypothetical protein